MKNAEALQELINEYRAAADAADAAKALIVEAFENMGIKKAVAAFEDAQGNEKVTTVTYRAASNDSLVFDSVEFCKDPARAALYEQFKTKTRKGASATVSFKRGTA